MLHAVIRFSVKQKLIIGLMIAGLVLWGGYAVTQLPIDAVPDITNNQVLVITQAPSLGAPDVERFITVPIEQATRNVPGIIEQRSFSRFGLSLVTIVFNDATDVYWARQQVSERLQMARQQIPAGMGDPELGPVTTGLGEIFQYVVKAKPGYEDKYDLMALRDIQDWIVRRQLLGTSGVADVSSFGGLVKQYAVAVNPDKLKAFQLTIAQVYEALQKNNSNAGGAYIEKGPNVLFIRSEGLVQTTADIGNIVIKQVNGSIPVRVKDIAEVSTGSAVRYGATIFNDEREVAGAVVMMLKGENSNRVIANIKERIQAIEQTLPEGVMIEPFLDRTKMVNNAITTVEHNLLEGALIVVFVLVLFLGNMRAGLIVASVIPLSMLFAVIMMNLFGVSGNLMSLGALDFGLLVDGAVIIVEAVMHRLSHSKALSGTIVITQEKMNEEVEHSAGKMMNSAVFGQMIILIVYLPILTLQGIEGKMFAPMAQTVSFAIIGAFILSLTYVPMMSSLALSKKLSHKDSFSDKMMHTLQGWYKPVLDKALKVPVMIVGAAFGLFALALVVLNTLGGEFIPQLEEGDFAVDTRLLTGASLSNTVSSVQKAAGVLLREFPEVEKIVTKVGSGEIPTDPMPLEAADMMVILKPKTEWTSAKTFPEMANKMSETLQQVPGIATGFQFPVQMRFNELMTGARQDVVCKIFGENLDTLAHYAERLGDIIQSVEGAKDLYRETVTGIPQVVITHNREAIARYGASIDDINATIQSAYAGATAGLVFENDRRYDLVIRMNEQQKKDVHAIGNLLVGLPDGSQVPLSLLASVEIKDGPYQIQRENAARRITVGFNVRDRDVQSIVTELQEKVARQVNLPAGYYITYGGQYENLQHATKRLSIALPVALLLIFLMLFFAFNKFRYCLLIFSAIPLSAIGGVFALWLRDMPFSISAGIGFIALFGVAVLNGIVLITELNRLKDEGTHTINFIIMHATQSRLRPVLMTAAVASLGFLPMAISSGAGAEVQRPLATVVIGGLISATLLTLFVLPALYLLFEKVNRKPGSQKHHHHAVLVLLCCLPFAAQAQDAVLTVSMEQAVSIATQQNIRIKAGTINEQYYTALVDAAAEKPKMQLTTEWGQINSASFDNKFTLSQSFALPGVYKKRKEAAAAQVQSAHLQIAIEEADIARQVKINYIYLQAIAAKQQLLQRTDSIFSRFLQLAQLRYEKGETNLLEKTTIDHYLQDIRLQQQMLQADQLNASARLAVLMNVNQAVRVSDTLRNDILLFDSTLLRMHPFLKYYAQQEVVASSFTAAEKTVLQPEWFVGYTNQSIIGYQLSKDQEETWYDGSNRFSTVQVGIGIPIFRKAQKARVDAALQQEALAKASTEIVVQQLSVQLNNAWNEYRKNQDAVKYYETVALPQSALIISNANLNYKNGAISYIEWGLLLNNAISIQHRYVDQLRDLNISKSELEYLLQSSKN